MGGFKGNGLVGLDLDHAVNTTGLDTVVNTPKLVGCEALKSMLSSCRKLFDCFF